MAYDGPTPAELRKWKPVGRGKDALFRKPASGPAVTLAPDVAEYFGTEEQVNDALRGLIHLAKQAATKTTKKRKKSA
jgi:hypothetical protein